MLEAPTAHAPHNHSHRLLLIDAELPRSSCIEAMLRLAGGRAGIDRRPSFICLAIYPDQHDAALGAGAARFLRKDGSRRELVEAVRAVAAPPSA